MFVNDNERNSTTMRSPGFSFCIISAGKRPEKLSRLIQSIQDQEISSYEIIVAGITEDRKDITYIPMAEAAQEGKISTLRNTAAAQSRHTYLVFVDDDIVLLPGWCAGITHCCDHYDLLSTTLLNLDGTRLWDWSTKGGSRGHVMLDYDETDDNIYLTGGLLVCRAKVWETIQWDEQREFYQSADVDFSQRAKEAGFKLCCCKDSVAVHDDPKYTQIGRRVHVRKETGIRIWLHNELAQLNPAELLEMSVTNFNKGLIAEAADCIRYCLWENPDNEVVNNRWQSFVEKIDDPMYDKGYWRPYPILDNE